MFRFFQIAHSFPFAQVETCQEKIITLELKDPITNAPLTEEQLLPGKITETTITPSDDENSSIITVRSNASNNESMLRLHLATDDGDSGSGDAHSGLAGSYLTAVQHHQPSSSAPDGSGGANDDAGMQTIVEVVNPLISGQGYAHTIAVGHSDGNSYPSFDQNNDADATAEANLDSFDTYNTASGLSLSDKMKNVLQELVKNERVRLSFSQSISDGDEDSDSERNDTDDDANEPLKHDSSDDESTNVPSAIMTTTTTAKIIAEVPPTPEENGNAVIAQLNIVDEHDDSGNNDDRKNANIIDDVDFIYKNPNFLMADDEIATTSQPNAANVQRNERDEKLKKKLLSELKVQPSGSDEAWTMDTVKVAQTSNVSTNDPNDEEESSISIQEEVPKTPTSPTSPTETSSKSDSISSTGSGKRKKRKNRPRKK